MNQKKLLNKFIKEIEIKSKNCKSTVDFFMLLRKKDFSRLEVMIIDSAIKKMPMENLYKTLLLPKDNYIKILYNLLEKISSI
jgi:hypothetical protein